MKRLIFILLFMVYGWSAKTTSPDSFNKERATFIQESLDEAHFMYLFNHFSKEELKKINLNEKDLNIMRLQIMFWRMMEKNYNSEKTYFGNS